MIKKFIVYFSLGLFLITPSVSSEASQEITLMNIFEVPAQKEQKFLEKWKEAFLFLKEQPGFIETKLHHSLKEPETWINYARWSSRQDFLNAVNSPEFIQIVKDFPVKGTPGLYEVYFSYGK